MRNRLKEAGAPHVAVSLCGGAAAIRKMDFSPLFGRVVSLYPDNNQVGRDAMSVVAEVLAKNGCTVRMIEPPGETPEGGDIADLDPAEWPAARIRELVENAPEWKSSINNEKKINAMATAVMKSDALEGATAEARAILEPMFREAQKHEAGLYLQASPNTEASAAHDFAMMFVGSLLWVKGSGWRVYSPHHGCWQKDRDELLAGRCAVFAAETRRKYIGMANSPREAERFSRSLLTRRGVRDVLELAKMEPELQADRAEFDRDVDAVVDANGQHIDLRTGRVRPATPEDRHFRSLGAWLDPEATCPKFQAFLSEVMIKESDRAYLQRLVGYMLTGRTSEQIVSLHTGTGQNGKGTFFHAIERCLGDYGATAPSSYVAPTSKSGKPEIQNARLEGVRAVFIRETELGARLD